MVKYDKNSGDYIVNDFYKGIAESPYLGIADEKNANIITIPEEASVNFATARISPPVIATGTITSADAGTDIATFTGAVGLENRMAIVFSAQAGLGVTTGVTYWVKTLVGNTFQLSSDYAQTTTVNLTNGTGTFSVAQVGINPITGAISGLTAIIQFAYSDIDDKYFAIDRTGALWSNLHTTTSGYWTYVGPSGTADVNTGRGLVYYQASDSTRWIFTFNLWTIDYFNIGTETWAFGWNPANGTVGNAGTLATTGGKAILGPDNKVYVPSNNFILRWYQADPLVPFVPTTPSTYVYDRTSVLPFNDTAQCLAFLGNNLLIGGTKNIIYPWDTFSQLPNYPIYLAEYNIVEMVTVNTNTYVLVGKRGRVYITNGSQAQLYKKIPDHISGTIEPYFRWGGLTSNKNQLYFSAYVTTNTGTAITTYGGLWAVDLDTKAIRLSNTLSYQTTTYNGYATALIPIFSKLSISNPPGSGLYIGWYETDTSAGIDITISTPYVGNVAVAETRIDSDLVPIGTALKPITNGRVEFKLSVPIVSGESVKIQYRQRFSDAFVDIDSNLLFNFSTIATGVWNGYTGVYQNVNFQNSQWVQLRAILISTATAPSYVRLTEFRVGP